MSQEQARRKKPLLISAAVIVLFAGGVLLYGTLLKNRKIQEVKDALARVPAPYTLSVSDIDASLFGRTLTVTGISGVFPHPGKSFELSIDKITGNGVNALLLADPGPGVLADSLTVTNLVLKNTDTSDIYTMAGCELQALRGDFGAVAREWDKTVTAVRAMEQHFQSEQPEDRPERGKALYAAFLPSLRGLLAAAETLRIDKLSARDMIGTVMAPSAGKVTLACATLDSTDFSPLAAQSVTLGDVVLSFAGTRGDTIDVTAAAIDGRGLNVAVFQTPGESSLLDSLTVTDMRFEIELPRQRGNLAIHMGSYELEDLTGDFGAMARDIDTLIRQANDVDDVFEHARPLFRDFATLRLGRAATRDGRISFTDGPEKIVLTVAGYEVRDYSPGGAGPMSMTGLAVAYRDMEVATLAELGMDGWKMPDYFGMLEAISAGEDRFLRFLRDSEMNFRNLHFKDLKIGTPSLAGISVKALALGMDYNKGAFSMNFTVEELAGSKHLLPARSQDVRAVQAMLPDRLVFSTGNELAATLRDDSGALLDEFLWDVTFKPLSASLDNFGSFEFSADLRHVSGRLLTKAPSLGSLSLTLADKGATNVLFALMARDEGITAQDAREQAVQELKKEETVQRGSLKEANQALQAFLQNPGGTFRLDIKPATPLNMEDFAMAGEGDPGRLGLTSSFTPGQ